MNLTNSVFTEQSRLYSSPFPYENALVTSGAFPGTKSWIHIYTPERTLTVSYVSSKGGGGELSRSAKCPSKP